MSKAKLLPYEDDLFKGVAASGVTDPKADLMPGEELKFVANKIPMSIYSQVLAFFDFCQKTHDSEGFLLLLYRDGQWSLGCPKQKISPAAVEAHPEETDEDFHGAVGDLHSHPGMGAFHSSIDDADELHHRHGIFMVVSSDSKMGFSPFTSSIDIVGYARGRKFQFDPRDIFDLTQPFGPFTFPEAWKSRVEKQTWKFSESMEDSDIGFEPKKDAFLARHFRKGRGFGLSGGRGSGTPLGRHGRREGELFGPESD